MGLDRLDTSDSVRRHLALGDLQRSPVCTPPAQRAQWRAVVATSECPSALLPSHFSHHVRSRALAARDAIAAALLVAIVLGFALDALIATEAY